MRIRLIRQYYMSSAGTVLNSVPTGKAMNMIKNGIAIPVEEPKGQKNALASHKKSKRRTRQSG